MKILLANKFYYRRGGDCVCTINTEELLKTHGHEVAIFAMQHPETLPTKWSKYFPSEVKFKPGPGMLETFMRPFGTNEVKKKFTALLDDFCPDVVHLNNIHSQLSPIIAELAHQRGIRVVWTLHDYKLLCPRYDCRKNGEVLCNKCYTYNKKGIIQHRCMKNSLLASYLAYWEAKKWNRDRLETCTNLFICPSEFMRSKMIEGGYNSKKLVTICNFIDMNRCDCEESKRENYYCYVGRLSYEKGVKSLVEAAAKHAYKLKLIGDGPEREVLNTLVKELNAPVEFLGHLTWGEIKEVVSKARFSILPSIVFENNPLSVIEAQCLGTPVLGANIGGIPELISENTGMTFESNNIVDLKTKIEIMFNQNFNYQKIAEQARLRYGADIHYNKLMKIYQNK